MNKNNQSYTDTISNDHSRISCNEIAEIYSTEDLKDNNYDHNAFAKDAYSTRKMTFGKIKYV